MLDFFSPWHLLILLIVALVVVGPKDLPKLMRMIGRWTGKARAMADQLRKSFDEMARQSELDELRAEIETLRHQRPLAEIDHSLHQPVLPADLPSPHPVEGQAPADAKPDMADAAEAAHQPAADAQS